MTYALPTTGLATDDAPTGPASTVGEVWDASLKAQRDVANPLSRGYVLDEEYDKRIREVATATGIKLHHPLRDAPSDADYLEARDDPEDGWQGSLGLGAVRKKSELRFHRELARLAEQHPDKAEALRPGATVWDEAYARVRKAEQASGDVTARSPLAVDVPLLGPIDPVGLAGSMAGFFYDPVNIATMFIGPGGSAAKGILWNASRQAVAGAAQQAAIEPFTQAWRAEAGLDFGFRQAAGNILMAGVASGALDAAGRSAWRGLAGIPQSGVPEPVKTPANDVSPDLDANRINAPDAVWASEGALESAARRLPEDHPARKAADGDPNATLALAERALAQSDDPDAMRGAMAQLRAEVLQEESILADLAVADGAEAAARRILAFDPGDEIRRAVAHVADPDSVPPTRPVIVDAPRIDDLSLSLRAADAAGRDLDISPEVRPFELIREQLVDYPGGWSEQIDATMQGGRVSAYRHREKKITRLENAWLDDEHRGKGIGLAMYRALIDEALARGDVVWSSTNNTNMAENIYSALKRRGYNVVKPERDPYARGQPKFIIDGMTDDFDPAKSDSANLTFRLRDGELGPVQAAALIRERPELAGEVAPTTETARGIHALAALSDAGFARVTAGEVEPQIAALVASSAPPGAHADLIDRLVAARPRDLDTARRLLAEMLQQPADASTARMILGLDEPLVAPSAAHQQPARGYGERLGAAEFDEPVGEAAKAQADALAPVAERAARIEDLSLSLRSNLTSRATVDAANNGRALATRLGVTLIDDISLDAPHPGPILAFRGSGAEIFTGRFRTKPGGEFAPFVGTAEVASEYANFATSTSQSSSAIRPKIVPVIVNARRVLDVFGNRDFYISPDEMRLAMEAVGIGTGHVSRNWSDAVQVRELRDTLLLDGFDAIRRRPTESSLERGVDHLPVWEYIPIRAGVVKSALSDALMFRLRDGSSLAGTAYAPKFLDAETQLAGELADAATRTLPRNVALTVADRLRAGGYELDGYFDRRNNILAVALDAGDPRATFTHERIHALKEHGLFTPEEWGLMVAEARKVGVRQGMGRDLVEAYREQLTPGMVKERLAARGVTLASEFNWDDLAAELQKAKLLDPKDVRGSLERAGLWDEARLQAMIDEETVARLAETWRAGGDVPAGVKGLLERVMAFLERVRNVLAGHGFQTLDDVFRRIDDGEVAMRTPREVELPGGMKIGGIHLRAGSSPDIAEMLLAIRAYHGSPHDFDKFSLGKIGTGEGAQVYGHGLYFAENEAVAKSYKNAGTPSAEAGMNVAAQMLMKQSGGDRAKAIQLAEQKAKKYEGKGLFGAIAGRDPELAQSMREAAAFLKNDGNLGRMYEVNIKANPDDFLDWDKPLSQQSEKVRQAVGAIGVNTENTVKWTPSRGGRVIAEDGTGRTIGVVMPAEGGSWTARRNFDVPGPASEFLTAPTREAAQEALTNLYKPYAPPDLTLEQAIRGAGDKGTSTAAFGKEWSEKLKTQGIPGIKYLDQGSRGAGEGSRNYVVFDDALIEIVAKDGVAVAPPRLQAALDDAAADADAGALVQACKLF